MTNVNWAIWRVCAAGKDPLVDIQTKWSLDDLFDAHEVLDVKAEAEAHEMKRVRRDS